MSSNPTKRVQIIFMCITILLVAGGWYAVFKTRVSPPEPTTQAYAFDGRTMGTTYSVKYFAERSKGQQKNIQPAVEDELKTLNKLLSIFDPTSEISRFNLQKTTQAVPISPAFAHVMTNALQIARQSGGTFDPTVAGLVSAWGFGPDKSKTNAPSPAAIAALKLHCGWQKIALDDSLLSKLDPQVKLDLSAIAKGYGVDLVVQLLEKHGIDRYIVEIGGETRCLGVKSDGTPWKIGIQTPKLAATPGQQLTGVIAASNLSIATSGNYQNFYYDETGTLRSHIIDPRTGYPAGHTTAGVTVTAETCLQADAWATALYVLGPDEGLLQLTNATPPIQALFVIRTGTNSFEQVASPNFKTVTHYSSSAL